MTPNRKYKFPHRTAIKGMARKIRKIAKEVITFLPYINFSRIVAIINLAWILELFIIKPDQDVNFKIMDSGKIYFYHAISSLKIYNPF